MLLRILSSFESRLKRSVQSVILLALLQPFRKQNAMPELYLPVVTDDGSLSCLDGKTGELCHNRAGAYTEAVHNYVQPSGLIERLKIQSSIRILDACYGLGYNSWALINELLRSDINSQSARETTDSDYTVSIVAIERYPEMLGFLPRVLEHPSFDTLKNKIPPSEHNAYYRTLECLSNTKVEADQVIQMSTSVVDGWRFEFEIWPSDLRARVPRLQGDFDAVFHDAFSPQKMPELWTADLFQQYYRLLENRRGVLLTYSAAAAIRGGLLEAGFQLFKTPGLGAKTGGTMGVIPVLREDGEAVRIPCPASNLEAWEQGYLATRAGLPYRDPGLQTTREAILSMRANEQAASSRPSGSTALKKKPRNNPAQTTG